MGFVTEQTLNAINTSCSCNGLFSFVFCKSNIGSNTVGLNRFMLSGILLSVFIVLIINALGALNNLDSFPVINVPSRFIAIA